MISQIAKASEDFVGLKFYRKGIEHDVKDGRLSQQEADELLHSLEKLRGYAALQTMLFAVNAIKRLCFPLLPWLTGLVIINIATVSWMYVDRRVDPQILHQPGFIILRCIPGMAVCIGNIAILRADPRLYDVTLRICERIVNYPILRLLIPIYIRPGMRALRWLIDLEWPGHTFA